MEQVKRVLVWNATAIRLVPIKFHIWKVDLKFFRHGWAIHVRQAKERSQDEWRQTW
jgi:hypothetical protein